MDKKNNSKINDKTMPLSAMGIAMLLSIITNYTWVHGVTVYTEDGHASAQPNVVYGAYVSVRNSAEDGSLQKVLLSESHSCNDIRSALAECLYCCRECHQLYLIAKEGEE